jgi:ferritin-like metal-binding protein YciE
MELNSLEDVLVEELADLYSAESQLVDALPRMAAAAHSPELRSVFEHHFEETTEHKRRLARAFADLGREVPDNTCKAMQGLIGEGNDVIESHGASSALDAALIGALQRVEHYEISAYGTARALANELELGSITPLLNDTLAEEARADEQLTKIATGGLIGGGVNHDAAMA